MSNRGRMPKEVELQQESSALLLKTEDLRATPPPLYPRGVYRKLRNCEQVHASQKDTMTFVSL
jgi:hypothetical protein